MGSAADDEVEETDQPIQALQQPAITEEVMILTIEVMLAWAEKIVEYLERGVLPEDKKKAIQLKIKAARFTLINGTLYKRGFMLPLLKCASKEEDNGKQFDCDSFWEWCAKLHIRNYFSSSGHPQANGQVEATNKTIFKILKKKLGKRKGNWAEDLPEVLWAYCTTKRTPTEENPYALTFGTEAVIPAEVGSGSFCVETFKSKLNDEGLKLHLDLLQEKRDQAQITLAAYQ
ncbi:uncharacterized protein LOC132169636 [Corylus avellana]|uniref:uncharacterized protein LOC132169636 n=1 Tax=Corylus avellana TaxID=13451 RepID=UPI00286B9797|nr:uncharacterized protein LOC132169636 [Corylus avellana]